MCSGISSAHSRHLDDWYRAMYERSVVIVQQAAQRSVRLSFRQLRGVTRRGTRATDTLMNVLSQIILLE